MVNNLGCDNPVGDEPASWKGWLTSLWITLNNLYHPKNSHEHRNFTLKFGKQLEFLNLYIHISWNSEKSPSNIWNSKNVKNPLSHLLKFAGILLGCSQFQVSVPETNKSPNKNSPQPLLLLLLVPNPLCNQGQHLPMPRAWNHHIADSFKCNSNSNISWCFDLKDLPQNFVLCKPVVLRSKEIFASQHTSTIFWTPARPTFDSYWFYGPYMLLLADCHAKWMMWDFGILFAQRLVTFLPKGISCIFWVLPKRCKGASWRLIKGPS